MAFFSILKMLLYENLVLLCQENLLLHLNERSLESHLDGYNVDSISYSFVKNAKYLEACFYRLKLFGQLFFTFTLVHFYAFHIENILSFNSDKLSLKWLQSSSTV